jgi:hypothetical protein
LVRCGVQLLCREDQRFGDFLEIAVGILEGFFQFGDQRGRCSPSPVSIGKKTMP